jgi:putative Holliday junction resolvase
MNRVLGIDHGEARIGLAVSDELGMLAHPLETIHLKNTPDPLARIAAICERDRIASIILGLPRNMNGSYGPAAEKIRAFAEKLRARVTCEVKLWDERLTSVAAQRSLHEVGRNVKNSREIIDQVAAQIILQSWLDSQAMK